MRGNIMEYKFAVGDKVVYTNNFGVCWGVKVITALDSRTYDLWGETHTVPTYHYADTDTPWFAIDEKNFVLADADNKNCPMKQEIRRAKHFQIITRLI